ncbi:hypothetical protein HS088_TW21G01026 [Tripterygium wilfordii]|uniref:BAG domain-containing protein n=1 Tax=Tripterygium wilfordii TaxID=458696 RepID=A0A7J7C425_TRIWF|nr:BAG family molecular chaperone regulator 5, mitochondrial [Tripterygium wilfordii]KAF5728872.1 hypothetical protein HS088_TW21G01026 [Tripterygium wilfordii]
MKSSRRCGFLSTTSSSVTYTFHNHHSILLPEEQTHTIPIESSTEHPIPITVHLPQQSQNEAAATKIQSSYRAHLIRTLYKIISTVNLEANHLQHLLQMQETVDAVRSSERERLRMNESLMALLLRLDSVRGIDPTVREARRKVSRRIVGMQEILDAVVEAKVGSGDDVVDYGAWGPPGNGGLWRDWDVVVAEMEEELCRERGGEEMERFCAQYLGFRCLQRFLRDP